jgi:hypothetical protein
VVRGPVDWGARGRQAQGGVGQLLPGTKQQGKVIEPRVAPGGARLGILVEDDEILVTRTQPGRVAVVVTEPQAQDALIEGDRAFEVADSEMDGPEAEGASPDRA